MNYLLGVDGGGTHTRVAIVSDSGQLFGWGRSGPSNYDDVGPEVARANIAQAIHAAWKQADLEPATFSAAFFGMAGVVSPTDRQAIREIVAALNCVPLDKMAVDHDCRIALAGGLLGRPGIVLITGTGSSCYGRSASGEDWRSGGWGPLISDEGSAYWFGLQAMRSAVRAYDQRDFPTRLLNALMTRLKLDHMNDLMHRLYVVGMSRAEIAELAPLVFEAAAQGDVIAQRLIDVGVYELAKYVDAVARHLSLQDQPQVVLSGGVHKVHRAATDFTPPLRQAILERLPGATVLEPQVSPVLGACLLALEILGRFDAMAQTALMQAEDTMQKSTGGTTQRLLP